MTSGTRTVGDRVADDLLARILSGSHAPGDALPAERELAESMAVSRGSLREALRALAFLGIIEVTHGGRAKVADIGLDSLLRPLRMFVQVRREALRPLLEARRALEVECARLAATRIDDAALERLQRLFDKKRQAVELGRLAKSVDLDAKFHQCIIEATDNPFLIEMGRSLYDLGRGGRMRTSDSIDTPRTFLDDHARILEGLRRRDPIAAAEAMARHIDRIVRHLDRLEMPPAKPA